ncbi:hypothetical protein [Aeropyrum camini]|uniref:Tyr recombinase domain-containing protein n=1 Tax=Aeropyrum camini SY1 = JCM 12091 TaxID=1198449 RepID=U3T8S3_9CREN|nr:hypothetical protein [Aeropyrum camini]BAN89927.1 hypothetical protein ACAM_0458 [Aeropyrum camini SY1 = JCM 12091]
MLPEPKDVPQEARRALLNLLAEKGRVKPRDLGVSRAYFYQMRRGLRPVPDQILEKLLEAASDDDLGQVGYFAQFVDYSRIRAYDVDRIVRLVLEWAKANPASAKVLLDTLESELERLGLAGRAVKVTEAHLEEWLAYLDSRREAGTLSYKQWQSHRIYLRRLLDSTGWVLSPGLVRRALLDEASRSPKAAQKMAESVRLFTREILQDHDLYQRLPRFRARSRRTEAPGWDVVCRVLEAAEWPPAKALLYLTLSGLRIETLYTIPFDKVDLDRRVVAPWSDRKYKRDFFSFIPEAAAAYLREVYLPWREVWLETQVKGQEELRRRFIPVKPKRLREHIYNVMDRALGRRFQLRTIRHRVTTHLALHLSKLEVDVLTGHASRDVVQAHYLQLDILEDLRRKYDAAMSRISCLSSEGD